MTPVCTSNKGKNADDTYFDGTCKKTVFVVSKEDLSLGPHLPDKVSDKHIVRSGLR